MATYIYYTNPATTGSNTNVTANPEVGDTIILRPSPAMAPNVTSSVEEVIPSPFVEEDGFFVPTGALDEDSLAEDVGEEIVDEDYYETLVVNTSRTEWESGDFVDTPPTSVEGDEDSELTRETISNSVDKITYDNGKDGVVSYKTFYKSTPIVKIIQTRLNFSVAKNYLSGKYNDKIARSAFALLLAEARKDSVAFKAFNNNYAGVQTDAGRWGESQFISGQFGKIDSGRVPRMFASFTNGEDFMDFLAKAAQRKKFDEGTLTAESWAKNYIVNWWAPANKNSYPKLEEKKRIFNSAMNTYNNV